MTEDRSGMLRKRKRIKARKPEFVRQDAHRYKKVPDNWRRPRGRHSGLRKAKKARGKKPSRGFGSPAAVRGLTREGYAPVQVSRPADLRGLDPKNEIAVISSRVGRKKRLEIAKEAEKLKVRVRNAYRARLPGSG